jgi:hypothetical protein
MKSNQKEIIILIELNKVQIHLHFTSLLLFKFPL